MAERVRARVPDSVPPTAAHIATDASWFPATLDLQRGTVGFARTDRRELAHQPFLDGRWDRSKLERTSLRFDEIKVPDARATDAVRLNFIWHTAFCSSTAIAGALDAPGKNLSLREPEALTLLADLKRANGGAVPANAAQILFALLARRFDAREAITVKPSNAANYLLPEAARLSSGRWLFLYSDCASFVTAIFRRGELRRAYVRQLFEKIAGDSAQDRRWPIENYFALTDLQIAAFCWHLQIAELRRAMTLVTSDRVASLDCDAFLDEPGRVLSETDRFLGLNIGSEQIATLIGTLMQRDAKSPASRFDALGRRNEWETLGAEARGEIRSAVAWSFDAFGVKGAEPPLPAPLVSLKKDYGPKA